MTKTLPTKHGYTFANTKNIRKASKMLAGRFHRKAIVWYSVYFVDFEAKDFRTIAKLRKYLKSNPSGIKRIEKTLTDRQHDTTLLELDPKTLKPNGWARN
jgi:hypothetical protein